MKTKYPSKSFFSDAAKAINTHELLEIRIEGGRGRILAKEVQSWLPFDEAELLKKGWKGPSLLCGLLMMKLHGIYYTALSANFELRAEVNESLVILTFIPH